LEFNDCMYVTNLALGNITLDHLEYNHVKDAFNDVEICCSTINLVILANYRRTEVL
jgi:hypothetical protein